VSTPSEPDDAALLRAFVGGSEEAFKDLVRMHQAPLYRFIWRQVQDHSMAADLCQKVFLQVFLKAGSFRGAASFRTWLYQIAINQCRNHFRASKHVENVGLDSVAPPVDESGDVVEAEQQTRRVRAAVDALPPKQRYTLQLRFYQECTFAEIAEIMSCPIGTAKANYHHAITALRKRLRTGDE